MRLVFYEQNYLAVLTPEEQEVVAAARLAKFQRLAQRVLAQGYTAVDPESPEALMTTSRIGLMSTKGTYRLGALLAAYAETTEQDAVNIMVNATGFPEDSQLGLSGQKIAQEEAELRARRGACAWHMAGMLPLERNISQQVVRDMAESEFASADQWLAWLTAQNPDS